MSAVQAPTASVSPPQAPRALPTFAGLTTSAELTRRQLELNRARAAAAHRSSLEGLTLRVAMQDIREAALGIPRDIARATGPVPLGTLLFTRDRLRGLGLLCLVLAIVGLVVA